MQQNCRISIDSISYFDPMNCQATLRENFFPEGYKCTIHLIKFNLRLFMFTSIGRYTRRTYLFWIFVRQFSLFEWMTNHRPRLSHQSWNTIPIMMKLDIKWWSACDEATVPRLGSRDPDDSSPRSHNSCMVQLCKVVQPPWRAKMWNALKLLVFYTKNW